MRLLPDTDDFRPKRAVRNPANILVELRECYHQHGIRADKLLLDIAVERA